MVIQDDSWFCGVFPQLLSTPDKKMVVFHAEFNFLCISNGAVVAAAAIGKYQTILCLTKLHTRPVFVVFSSSWENDTDECSIFPVHMYTFQIHHLPQCHKPVWTHRDCIL